MRTMILYIVLLKENGYFLNNKDVKEQKVYKCNEYKNCYQAFLPSI
jgi:hypothetical protein